METSSVVLLLHNAVIVTMDSGSRVFRNGAVVVSDTAISAIGHSPDILRDYSHQATDVVDLGGRILLPGFVNTHVHTSQQLGRGIADDVDLMTWLHERIWPYESNMTEEDSYLSTLLCGIELIRTGVTCFAEAGGQHVSGMARAVELLGIRACLTQSTMDYGEGLPAKWSVHSTEYCIESQKELYRKHHNTADGRIRVWFGLRQIMNASDKLLVETRDIAAELQTGIHMHVAEIPYENQHVIRTREVDHGTVTYLEKIGLLRSNLLAAHSVHVNDREIGFLSRADVKVSHCPAAAMRMLGFAPIREMLDAGVCVSLGTDGAPSNNRMSIVDEMYLASLINKGREAYITGTTNPTVVPAETILRMVTVNGAKSVLWDEQIGSLEVGKKADMIVVNPFSWSMVPLHDCISSLVYCMRSENIDSVMCNGRWVMKDQKILSINEVIVEMDQRGVAPSGRTFAVLIRRLVAAGLTRQAVRTFDDMEGFIGREADGEEFKMLLDTLSKYGYPKVATEIFNKRKFKFEPDEKAYTILIYGWSKVNRHDMAQKFLKEMIDRGVEPNAVTYNVLLNGICRHASLQPDNRFDRTIIAAENLLKEMRSRGIEPDVTSYSIILHVYSRAHKPELTVTMLNSMREKGISPTVTTYTSVIKCLASCGRIEDAEGLLDEMTRNGVCPSPAAYNCFFKEYRGRKDVKAALKLYTKMKETSPPIVPDMHTFNILVGMFSRLNRMETVLELWNDMKEHGVGPDLDSYTLLIHGLCEKQKWREACEFFMEMIEKGFLPQKVTFEILYRGLIQSDMLRTWRRLKKKVEEEFLLFGAEFQQYQFRPYKR